MAKLLDKLTDRGLIHPPKFLSNNLQYLVKMGSQAYSVADEDSDIDVYGWTIPLKTDLFPHLAGEIPGFGTQKKRFENWQEHHVQDTDSGKEYDFSVFSVVNYFHLCMQMNPNMVDSLFVPSHSILHCSEIAQMVRDNRKVFLSKLAFHRFRGYSASQRAKMRTKTNPTNEKRRESIEKFSFDVKFAYHLVRLMLECEQILATGTLILDKDKETLKAIRRGEWSLEKIDDFFDSKEADLNKLYHESDAVPYNPREEEIKALLLKVLEAHYGSLDKAVVIEGKMLSDIRKIAEIAGAYL